VTDFIVEDGTGVLNATSLVSVAFADSYFSNHPFYADNWSDYELAKKQSLLIFATDVIVSMLDQYAYTSYYGPNVVALNLKKAICEQAVFMGSPQGNPDLGSNAGVTELKIDVIGIKFGTASTQRAVPVAVARLLKGLGGGYSSGRVRRVQVGLG
jgi:hypothetical protein